MSERLAGRAKLLFLVGGFQVGGTEQHLSLVLPRLSRERWNISVRLLGLDGPLSESIRAAGLDMRPIESDVSVFIPKVQGVVRLVSQVKAVANEIYQIQPDLVHCFLPEPSIMGWLARKWGRQKPKLVMSRRSQNDRPESFLLEKRLERLALRSADYVLAHSSAVRDEIEAMGVSATRLRKIHNGILIGEPQDADGQSALRSRFGWDDEDVLLVCVANLIPYKGHVSLLSALGSLVGKTAPFRLVLIGQGEASVTASLKQQAKAQGLESFVVFLGRSSEVARQLRACDVGVLASEHEGFSNALIEYMAAGLSVVATSVGGNRDAVEHDVTGLLVPPRDTAALAAALKRLIDDRSFRGRLGLAGRERAVTHFSIEECVANYEAFYDEVL